MKRVGLYLGIKKDIYLGEKEGFIGTDIIPGYVCEIAKICDRLDGNYTLRLCSWTENDLFSSTDFWDEFSWTSPEYVSVDELLTLKKVLEGILDSPYSSIRKVESIKTISGDIEALRKTYSDYRTVCWLINFINGCKEPFSVFFEFNN
jgi:hypothetical protein